MSVLDTFAQQWQAQNGWEIVAVLLSIAYIIFAARANSLCWLCAFFSTAIFSVIFFDANLLQESALNIYYLIIAVYGWYSWRFGHDNNRQKTDEQKQPEELSSHQSQDRERMITRWPLTRHLFWIVIMAMIALLSGVISDKWLQADMPYLNGFTVWFAVYTTFLVARKVLENWYYWMVLNPVSFYIFYQQELYVTCALMIVYFIMSIYGLLEWKKQWRQQNYEACSATAAG